MSTNVYILLLEEGKYYVGKSNDVSKRFREHIRGAASWTRKYKPIMIEKIIENVSPFEEDKVTKEYMAKYGINNVRGGSYVTDILDDIQMEALTRELRGATDACQACGVKGHFMKGCHIVTYINISQPKNGYKFLNDEELSRVPRYKPKDKNRYMFIDAFH